MSLRSSERGLKYADVCGCEGICQVAPFVGAWIEIPSVNLFFIINTVAPFVGAWIEIHFYCEL